MNTGTLHRNAGNKLFVGSVHHANRTSASPLRAVREVVVVRSRVVPDFVCIAYLRDQFPDFPGSRINGQAAQAATHRHQAPVRPGYQAAQRGAEGSAFAFHRKAPHGIRELVRIEHINSILVPRDVLVKPSGLPDPSRLFHSILPHWVLV